MNKKYLLILFSLFCGITAIAQTITNVGTDFWIAFPPNGSPWKINLFISSNFSTSGTVVSAFPGVNQNFTVIPGVVTQLSLPVGICLQGGIEDKGIHIVSIDPISVYGLNKGYATTDAFLALPINAVGLDYRIVTYKTTMPNYGSCFSVVATQNATILNVFNHQTNSTIIINLNQGQTYHVEASNIGEDVTGSRVQSNFPVAVFGSVDIVNVPKTCGSADHIVEQMFPYYSWGKNFVTVPLAGRDASGDIFRIVSAQDGTDILINGIPVPTINSGDYYESNLTGYNLITTSKPVILAQFAKGIGCSGGTTGDPFMMLIPPREQFLTNYTVSTVAGFVSHWVNVVAPDYALGTIYQDGVLIPNAAFIHIGATNYYGAQRPVSEGSHTFTSTFPFGVFVYGWTSSDSYGYPGGCSLSPVGMVNSVTISPPTATGTLDVSTLCFTAHVEDYLLNPVAGVLVTFNISGISNITGHAYTDPSGNAQYCYARTGTTTGIDNIYAECFGYNSTTSTANWILNCLNPTEAGTIGNNQSGCGSFTPSPITSLTLPSGQSGTLEYKWQQSTTSAISGFTDIAMSNSADYSPGLITQTTWYRRVAKVDCMSDWTGAAMTDALEMIVYPVVLVGVTISSSANTVCAGTPVTFTAVPVNGGSTPVYQWKVNTFDEGTNTQTYTYAPVNGDVVQCILTSSNTVCTSNNPATSNAITLITKPGPEVSFTPCFDVLTTVNAKPFKLKGGLPLGGTYSGSGVNPATEMFNPGIAGSGTHQINYSYTDISNCTNTKQLSIVNYPLSIFTCGSALTDIRDGKSYQTVQIGTQCWMAANLNYGLTVASSQVQYDNCTSEKYCYNDMVGNCTKYGGLYQWDEVMKYDDTPAGQGLCPPGWHVPVESEWTTLFNYYQGNAKAGKPMQDILSDGFKAIPGGVFYLNTTWSFEGFATFFWSSTPLGTDRALVHGMNTYNFSVSEYPSSKANAFPVRCLRD
ncbi:MAG: FISUMP domain-containing protein [Bacteroidales bacterium]|nr:FISUMP domain-containing protein [Bacteroidales bacterium]